MNGMGKLERRENLQRRSLNFNVNNALCSGEICGECLHSMMSLGISVRQFMICYVIPEIVKLFTGKSCQ